MTGIEVVGVVLAIPALIELCRHTLIAIQDVRAHLNYARLAVAYGSQCKALPKQVSDIIRHIERHLGCMESLLNQDKGYLLDPLVQDTIKEFQLCGNCCLAARSFS